MKLEQKCKYVSDGSFTQVFLYDNTDMSVTRGDTEIKQFLMTSILRMNSLNWSTMYHLERNVGEI